LEVRRLALTGFRSYPSLEVSFAAGPQVLFGPNAAGKTNLLEALAVLGLGRSHRTSADSELIAWGSAFARIEGDVMRESDSVQRIRPSEPTRLEIMLQPSGSPGRKRVRVNGVPRRSSSLAETLRVVVFAPEDMLLVVGSPGLRRSTLDTLAAQRSPAYARSLSTYGRALQQRNSLLRQIRDDASLADQLPYWNEILITEGATIVSERLALLEAVVEPLAAAHREIAPEDGRLSISYVTNAEAQPNESAADALRRRLRETSEKEVWNGTTLVGPHRDDLLFQLDARDMATFASRGQQRSAILALKLAELELLRAIDGAVPLLLLDDVFSELDPERRTHLVRRLGSLPQAFVTTTSLDDLDPALVAASTAWRVSPGRVDADTGRRR
jgi:DNA replication and repair protein RecF